MGAPVPLSFWDRQQQNDPTAIALLQRSSAKQRSLSEFGLCNNIPSRLRFIAHRTSIDGHTVIGLTSFKCGRNVGHYDTAQADNEAGDTELPNAPMSWALRSQHSWFIVVCRAFVFNALVTSFSCLFLGYLRTRMQRGEGGGGAQPGK